MEKNFSFKFFSFFSLLPFQPLLDSLASSRGEVLCSLQRVPARIPSRKIYLWMSQTERKTFPKNKNRVEKQQNINNGYIMSSMKAKGRRIFNVSSSIWGLIIINETVFCMALDSRHFCAALYSPSLLPTRIPKISHFKEYGKFTLSRMYELCMPAERIKRQKRWILSCFSFTKRKTFLCVHLKEKVLKEYIEHLKAELSMPSIVSRCVL